MTPVKAGNVVRSPRRRPLPADEIASREPSDPAATVRLLSARASFGLAEFDSPPSRAGLRRIRRTAFQAPYSIIEAVPATW
jgi:hypothetical protein